MVLSSASFGFIFRWALRFALRKSQFVTLVTIGASREYVGVTIDLGWPSLREVAEKIQPTIREIDLIGEIDGRLGLLLSDTDLSAACQIIERISETLEQVRFSVSSKFAVGAACCPAHGTEMECLVAYAVSHPSLNIGAGSPVVAAPLIA